MNEHKFVGCWISADMSVDNRQAPIFKKLFNITKPVKSAFLYICGLGLFEAKINGALPDASVLNPTNTQYSKTVLYRAFDITDLIKIGENSITVELGNGFFNETVETWNWHTASWRSAPKLIADIVLTFNDGTTLFISTDESWAVTLDGPIIENSIYYGETHDLRRAVFSWKNAVKAEAPTGELKLQKSPPMKRIEEYKPVEIIKKSDNTYIAVAPEMLTGWARLTLDLPENCEISVNYGERLNDDGLITKIGKGEGRDGNWFPRAYIQEDKFIGNGSCNAFEPKFSYKGFKYIQIDNSPCELTAENITLYRVANDVECISEFKCSNELINSLHSLMKRTLLNNFQGKPTDTPVWEKNGWLGDFSCGLTSMMFNFDMSDFGAEFVDTMRDCFLEYGTVPVMVPTADWGTDNSPVWNTVFVFAAKALLDYCNKVEYVNEIYPYLKKFAKNDIEALKKMGGLWNYKGLADWLAPIGGFDADAEADPNSSEGAEICANAFIYKMLCDMACIAEKLGKDEDISIYIKPAERLLEAFNDKFLIKEKGIYETSFWVQRGLREKYRQTSNLLPLAFDMVPDSFKETVLKNLVKNIVERDYHLDTGCIGTKYILPVLFDNGYFDVAFKVLTQTTYPSWGFWLGKGATSAWESWETTTRSENHYFLATYDEVLFTHFGGVKNVSYGYRSFTLNPEFNIDLDFVELTLKTPSGLFEMKWYKEKDIINVDIVIPEKSTVNVELNYGTTHISERLCGGHYNRILK